jgi:hypothetical protein
MEENQQNKDKTQTKFRWEEDKNEQGQNQIMAEGIFML